MILPYLSLQSLFRYDSSYWTRTSTHNNYSHGLNGGLDNREYKGTTYWRTPFKEICVGMKHNDNLRAFTFSYQASSLYSLIADGKYCPTHLRRFKWKSLISESSLQRNCDREGFNVYNPTQEFAWVFLQTMKMIAILPIRSLDLELIVMGTWRTPQA